MMGQLLWPVHLSADYTLENVNGVTTPIALAILVLVLLLQMWLAAKSRLGALGVGIYWLGLATVSNFVRFIKFWRIGFIICRWRAWPMQLLAVLLGLRSRPEFWMVLVTCFFALLPMTLLTLLREEVFASDAALWVDTVQVSPYSWLGYYKSRQWILTPGKAG